MRTVDTWLQENAEALEAAGLTDLSTKLTDINKPTTRLFGAKMTPQDLEEMIPDTSPTEETVRKALRSARKPAKLDKWISTLPETYQRVHQLRIMDGMTQEAVAVRLGQKQGNVAYIEKRIIHYLRVMQLMASNPLPPLHDMLIVYLQHSDRKLKSEGGITKYLEPVCWARRILKLLWDDGYQGPIVYMDKLPMEQALYVKRMQHGVDLLGKGWPELHAIAIAAKAACNFERNIIVRGKGHQPNRVTNHLGNHNKRRQLLGAPKEQPPTTAEDVLRRLHG